MTTKTTIALSIVATMLGASSVALACGPDGAKHFDKLDANKDGVVTQAEFALAGTTRFDEADANKDGKVTPEERKAVFDQHGKDRFAEHDKNKDGKLTGDELGRMPEPMRKHVDANGDGAITQAELEAHKPPKGARKHEGRGPGPGHDKTVTKEEAKAKAAEHFARLDANKDGKLTKEELAAGKRGHRPHHDRDDDEEDEG